MPWNGTHAVDELSLASPIDAAQCGRIRIQQILQQHHNYSSSHSSISSTDNINDRDYILGNMNTDNNNNNSNNNTSNAIVHANSTIGFAHNSNQTHDNSRRPPSIKILAYIASDSKASAKQISDHLQWPTTFLAPTGCHIDFNSTAECSYITLLYWFILSLNDYSVYQSYKDIDTGYQLSSISFSRYAWIYSLQQNKVNALQYASSSCGLRHSENDNNYNSIDKSSIKSDTYVSNHFSSINNDLNNYAVVISRTAQGNWVCTGGKIY